jgi:AcrR family transcriptional regulator
MAEPVKTTRRYDSPRRREQAAATRRQILDAAERLLASQGYATTTMAAIAVEAGVTRRTVYVAFETKGGVLRAVWNRLLRGDEDDAPVADREWYREVVEEPDAERQLRLNARNSRTVKQRAGWLMGVIRSGAAVDPEIAELWSTIQADFYEAQRPIVASLHANHALRPGLGLTRATDLLWMLNHPDVWLLLVLERGWTPEQYEQWFAEASCSQLLAGDARPASR